MATFGTHQDIEAGDDLNGSGELYIEIAGDRLTYDFLDKDGAQQLIAHLQKVFELENDQ